MRIVHWHGYLLGATGSNVYAQSLTREWSLSGHDVTLLCQEPHPERYDIGGAKIVRPDIAGLLPVFVLDRYEGLQAKLVGELTHSERDRYVELNAAAVRDLLPADVVFVNHVILGAPVGAASGARYAVKAHGSELEYAMRGNAELSAWGRETLRGAEATFVGSQHIRNVLEAVVGHVDDVHEVSPGVDIDEFHLEPRDEALPALLDEARQDPPNPGNGNERLPDEGNAERIAEFFAHDAPTVVFFGKLIYNKGVHVLLEALRDVDARTVVVGFGDYRAHLEEMAPPRTLFTGPLEHRHLVHLLPLGDVTVVPSVFPEAFGMVAAEAAAAGSPPLVARHSGLAEIAAGLEAEYPDDLRHLASFTTGDSRELATKLNELLALPPSQHDALKNAARRATTERWSWKSVAERLLEPLQIP